MAKHAKSNETPATDDPPKKPYKRLREGERRLAKELDRYREIAKKVKHDIGGHALTEDRERVKKAEWMHESVTHYLKDFDKKAAKSGDKVLDETFHASVDDSVADLKAARKRLKALIAAK